jgi:hypothetical protein
VLDSRELVITMNLHPEQNMELGVGEAVPAILEYDGASHVVELGRMYQSQINNVCLNNMG